MSEDTFFFLLPFQASRELRSRKEGEEREKRKRRKKEIEERK